MYVCWNMVNLQNVMLIKSSQIQKVTYYMIPFMWNIQNRGNYADRMQIGGFQGLGGGGGMGRKCLMGEGFQFRVMEILWN